VTGSAAEVILGTSQNDFINSQGGDDAVDAGAGNDILDGGEGSNFLTGGAGHDIFFLDGRGGKVTWGTITDFVAGEEVTLWGYRPGTSTVTTADNEGASGFQGRTFHFDLDANGSIDASLTFSGLTAATTNTFSMSSGTVEGNPYLHIQG